jgi:hypothetical protein
MLHEENVWLELDIAMRRVSETRERLSRTEKTSPSYRDVRLEHLEATTHHLAVIAVLQTSQLEHLSASVHELERQLAKGPPSLGLQGNVA